MDAHGEQGRPAGATRYAAVSVDDEPGAHAALRALLRGVADIELVASHTTPEAALHALRRQRCDLLFLDVAMPQMSGLELLGALDMPPVTVLLTAHAQHAYEAFERGVRDYLLKPISAPRLARCIEHVRPLLAAARADPQTRMPARIAIKCGTGHRLLDPAAIMRVEAAGNFSIVHVRDEQVFASEPLKDLQERLAPLGFVRVHKSHVVDVRRIRSLSAAELLLDNGSAVPVGRAYRQALGDVMRV